MVAQSRTVLLIIIGVFNNFYFGNAKFVLKKFENCGGDGSHSLKVNLTIKNFGDKQYLDGTLVMTVLLDNTIRSNVSVKMLDGNQYVYLTSINERKSCDALNKYFGEMWYDIERHAQIIPGLCPIVEGRYQLHNHLLNFAKMATVTSFPFGNLHFHDMVYDKKNNLYTCLVIEVENRI